MDRRNREPRPTGPIRGVIAVGLVVLVALTGCSGDDAPTEQSTDPDAGSSPAAIRAHYEELGVAGPVIDCFMAVLDELGVSSLAQLQEDQDRGRLAADRLDRCAAPAAPTR